MASLEIDLEDGADYETVRRAVKKRVQELSGVTHVTT